MVRVYWQPGTPICPRFNSYPDPDPKWRSRTVANTSCHCRLYGGIPCNSGWFWCTTTFTALSVNNRSGIHSGDIILCHGACWRYRQHHLMGIQPLYPPMNQSWRLQYPEWQWPSRLSLIRWHMETNSQCSTCCMPKMWISLTRIWTIVLMSRKTHVISTLCHIIPYHPERNHQATAMCPTVHGFLGFSMGPISATLKTVWAGKLWWMRKLDSNFKAQLNRDCIHSITGVF